MLFLLHCDPLRLGLSLTLKPCKVNLSTSTLQKIHPFSSAYQIHGHGGDYPGCYSARRVILGVTGHHSRSQSPTANCVRKLENMQLLDFNPGPMLMLC